MTLTIVSQQCRAEAEVAAEDEEEAEGRALHPEEALREAETLGWGSLLGAGAQRPLRQHLEICPL